MTTTRSPWPSRTASPASSPARRTRPSPTRPTGPASTSRWTAATAPAAPARRSASRASTTAAPTSRTRCPPTRPRPGYVLPCSMKPRSDLVLQIASTSAVAKTRAATYTGDHHRPRAALARPRSRSRSRSPDRDQLAFLPGQYVNIAVPGTDETRSYSFSNAPGRRRAGLPGEAHAGRGDVDLADRAGRRRRRGQLHRPERQLLPARVRRGRCCCSPAAPGSPRSCRSCASCATAAAPGRRTSSTASAPTTTSSSWTRSRSSPADPGSHLGLLRRGPGDHRRRTRAT